MHDGSLRHCSAPLTQQAAAIRRSDHRLGQEEGDNDVGYDMYLETVPDHLKARRQEYLALEDRSAELRGKPDGDAEKHAVLAALEALEDPAYFRASIGGMIALRDVMSAAGMVAPPARPPSWVHPNERSIPVRSVGRDVNGVEHWQWVWDSPEYRSFIEQTEYRCKGTIGIAMWKLCSNDGWVVTAEECSEALAVWDSLTSEAQRSLVTEHIDSARDMQDSPEEARIRFGAELRVPVEQLSLLRQYDDEFWAKWLAWLRLGADSEGFIVW